MASQILLIRHGETPWSITGEHTGRTDLPLTDNGERGASRLRGLLSEIKPTRVFTSPQKRARRTCELAGFGPLAQVDPDLCEWNYGAYEGRRTADIRLERPDWNVFQDGCPEGESVGQISQRADHLLDRLRPIDGSVALFSHGQFLRVLTARWIGLPAGQGRHLALEPASLSILGYEHPDTDVPAIRLWNAVPKAV